MGRCPKRPSPPLKNISWSANPANCGWRRPTPTLAPCDRPPRVLGRSLSNADSPGCVFPAWSLPGRHGSGDCGGRFVDQPSGYGEAHPFAVDLEATRGPLSKPERRPQMAAPAVRPGEFAGLFLVPAGNGGSLRQPYLTRPLWRHRDRKPASWFRERSRDLLRAPLPAARRTASEYGFEVQGRRYPAR